MSNRIKELIECDRILMLTEFDRDKTITHSGTKGSARENILIRFLTRRLPARYGIGSGHVVNSKGKWSRQQDILIYDRLNSPLLEHLGSNQSVVPIESILCVIEVKSTLSLEEIRDMNSKANDVRSIARHTRHKYLSPLQPANPVGILFLGFAFESTVTTVSRVSDFLMNLPKTDSGMDAMCLLRDKNDAAGFFIIHSAFGIRLMPGSESVKGKTSLRAFLFEILTHLQSCASFNQAPDLSEYMGVVGLGEVRQLQLLVNKFFQGKASDEEIVRIIHLMGKVPTENAFLDENSVFMFEKKKYPDGTIDAELWMVKYPDGLVEPIRSKAAFEAAERKIQRSAPSKRDQHLLQSAVQWFRRMHQKDEKLVIKAEDPGALDELARQFENH